MKSEKKDRNNQESNHQEDNRQNSNYTDGGRMPADKPAEGSTAGGRRAESRTKAEMFLSAAPLLLGIISMLFIFINSWIGIILAVGGVILGLSVRHRYPEVRILILSGIVCSAAGIMLGTFSMIFKLWIIGEVLTFFS